MNYNVALIFLDAPFLVCFRPRLFRIWPLLGVLIWAVSIGIVIMPLYLCYNDPAHASRSRHFAKP